MISSPDSDYPRLCVEVGLTCVTCTEATATQLAAVCKGLKGKMIGQMFVQIHPHTACAPMHAHFGQAYRDANREQEPGDSREAIAVAAELPPPKRRGPVPARPRVMVAVA